MDIAIYLAAWLGLAVLAILNGTLRQYGYGRFMSELSAHQVSTVLFILLMSGYVYLLERLRPLGSAREALLVGSLWFLMTVCFEFLFGHYVAGHTWERLLADYDMLNGRLWALVLVWTFAVPYVMYRLTAGK